MTMLAYVSCAGSGEVDVLAIDERTGELALRQRVELGGMLMPMFIARGGRHLHVARRSEPLAVVTLAIDAGTGLLTRTGEAPLPHSMAYLSTDATGRHLFSASYGGHQIAVSPIGEDGLPRAARQVLPTGDNAHCIVQAPGSGHVYSTCLGGAAVLHWRFDAAAGLLSPAEPAQLAFAAGVGPRHLAFHPSGRRCYLLGELDASITLLDIDARTGGLSPRLTVSALPAGFTEGAWASDLHLTPDARFLYASERRSNTLAAFAVDAADGALALIGHVPTETQPRGFSITPDGRFLLAAGQLSHRVTSYAIAPARGTLTPCHSLDVGQDPNWIECRPAP
ncbi:lactonase family protein [Variovorax beijingensis]|uniref:Lactonase family protein n=1 Tax=Variovorax beijingensis TaxID=2496117 RepID=A0ABX9ZX38_9BURK|nr:lactonase family protein [Variovorax beijingensis]RSZ24540.1 lactonase family protein [Variovorax beijingensis]